MLAKLKVVQAWESADDYAPEGVAERQLRESWAFCAQCVVGCLLNLSSETFDEDGASRDMLIYPVATPLSQSLLPEERLTAIPDEDVRRVFSDYVLSVRDAVVAQGVVVGEGADHADIVFEAILDDLDDPACLKLSFDPDNDFTVNRVSMLMLGQRGYEVHIRDEQEQAEAALRSAEHARQVEAGKKWRRRFIKAVPSVK